MNVSNSNIDETIKSLSTQSVLIIDIETSGLDVLNNDELCGIGIGTAVREYYFPFRHTVGDNVDIKYLAEVLKVLENKILIGFNIKFDLKGLYKEGFSYQGCYFIDVIVMSRLCHHERRPRLSLTDSLNYYFDESRSSYDIEHTKYMRKNKIKRHTDVDPSIEGEYCCNDLKGTRDLYFLLGKIIKKTKQKNVWIQECKLTKTLLNMEIYGTKIDLEYANRCYKQLSEKLSNLEKSIFELTKKEFNINSHKQLSIILQEMGIKSPEKTKTGDYSWSQKAIAKINHPVVNCIKDYRSIGTLANTFFSPYLEKNRDIVNTSFRNWVAITGRLSCSEPNLQNIPKKTKSLIDSDNRDDEDNNEFDQILNNLVSAGAGGFGASSGLTLGSEGYTEEFGNVAARRLFIPRLDYNMFAIDTSQTEVVVFLYYIGDYDLLKKVKEENFDFHSYVAINAFGASLKDENFKYYRQIAKGITFGIIYGMGINTLSIAIGKTQGEAIEFRDIYFKLVPKALSYMSEMKRRVENGEYIYNDYGRRYIIPPERSYLVINYMVQGTAGEIIKEYMIELDKFLINTKSHMLIQIHDELLFEIHKDETEILHDIVRIMSQNKLNIPMGMDTYLCDGSWANKKEFDLKTLKVVAK